MLDAFENLTTVTALGCQGIFVSSDLLVWDLIYAADVLVADESAILPEIPGAFIHLNIPFQSYTYGKIAYLLSIQSFQE